MNKRTEPNPQDLSQQDKDLFSNALNNGDGVTHRIKQDKIHPVTVPSKRKTQQKSELNRQRKAGFYFSDEFIPDLPTQGPLSYVKEGQSSFLAKQLRRGDFYPDLILDLHGYNKDDTKLLLSDLIDECRKRHIQCANIVHGIGEYILKKKIPHYLVQHPMVVAFHQAPMEFGGKGALLILIELDDRSVL
jgi:DNA-nicking Smr family endonuclease